MRPRHLAEVSRVLGGVFRSPDLRRVQLAFAGFNAAEWGVWIAMLVYAYDQGGTTTAGVVAVAQLVPAAVAAPFASVLADRRGSGPALRLGYAAQAGAMGATAAALLLGAPALSAYALAALAATCVTVTRPSQAALLPSLSRTPEELTAANVASGWIESVSVLVAPALTGVLLAVGSPGVVFALMAAVALGSALLVSPVARRGRGGSDGSEVEGMLLLTETFATFHVLARVDSARLLVAVLGAEAIALGALDVLYVVLAIAVLDLGDGGAGYLNAAFGAGGVLAIGATATFVGRRHLVAPMVLGVAASACALVVLGARSTVIGAFLLIGIAGASRSVVDVSTRTLLQRTAPSDVLARVFGVVEGLTMAGLAVGSALLPLLVALGGTRAALFGIAAILPLVLLAGARTLVRVDSSATVPVVEIALLRSSPIFAPLPPPTLEGLARELHPVHVPPGEVFIRQGVPGDRFYVIADGQAEVEVDGRPVAVRRRGDGVGEVALLRDVPRTATVRAQTPLHLYALEKGPFLAAVTGHDPTLHAAHRIMDERSATPA